MNTKRFIIPVLLAAMLIVGLVINNSRRFYTPTRRPSGEALNKAFPADSRDVLEHSDQFILYSIEPYLIIDEKGTFHGYHIFGQTQIADQKERAKLIAYLYDGLTDEHIFMAGCFTPHHAIRAIRGKKIVDLVICFSCSGIDIYYGQQQGHTNVGNAPQPYFDSVLTNAAVPLSHS